MPTNYIAVDVCDGGYVFMVGNKCPPYASYIVSVIVDNTSYSF